MGKNCRRGSPGSERNLYYTITTRIGGVTAAAAPPPPPNPFTYPPKIGGTPTASVTVSTPYPPFTPTAADFAGNNSTLFFYGTNLPAWLTVDPTVGTLSGTAPANPETDNNIILTVSDGCSTASLTFSIQVTPHP
jgi:Putative Ig domain